MTAIAEWILVDPVARRRENAPAVIARRRGELRTVAFFSNSKQHAAEVEAALAEALVRSNGITPRFYSKPNASVAAAPELLRNIATECDAAVVGSGD